jgi:ABC1 atypical kinase-like domain
MGRWFSTSRLSVVTHMLRGSLLVLRRDGSTVPGVQVHKAKLHDGRDVVVKVQYPGVAESIDSDLKNLQRLVCWL